MFETCFFLSSKHTTIKPHKICYGRHINFKMSSPTLIPLCLKYRQNILSVSLSFILTLQIVNWRERHFLQIQLLDLLCNLYKVVNNEKAVGLIWSTSHFLWLQAINFTQIKLNNLPFLGHLTILYLELVSFNLVHCILSRFILRLFIHFTTIASTKKWFSLKEIIHIFNCNPDGHFVGPHLFDRLHWYHDVAIILYRP